MKQGKGRKFSIDKTLKLHNTPVF